MATISRAEMEAAIRAGGSVILPSGQIAGRIEDLPSDASLAAASGDAGKKAAAREAIEARKKALEAQLAELDAVGPSPPEAEKPEPPKADEPRPAPKAR